MDNAIITTLISTSGAVIVGLGGMWISTNQVGKRIDDFRVTITELSRRIECLEDEFRTFKDAVNGKLSTLDNEMGKLMDKLR